MNLLVQPIDLEEWLTHYSVGDSLFWKERLLKHILLIKDRVPLALACGQSQRVQDIVQSIEVIATRLSKAIDVPIFRINLTRGRKLIIGYDFDEWKISVLCYEPLSITPMGLFDPTDSRCTMERGNEAFPAEYVFEPYQLNQSRFTLTVPGDDELFMLMWMIGYACQPQSE